MADPVTPTEALEAEGPEDAALEAVMAVIADPPCSCHWVDIGVGYDRVTNEPDCPKHSEYGFACALLAAASPHLIAEGRRRAAEAIRAAAEGSPLVVMRGGDVGFGAAQAYDSAARIAEGTDHA